MTTTKVLRWRAFATNTTDVALIGSTRVYHSPWRARSRSFGSTLSFFFVKKGRKERERERERLRAQRVIVRDNRNSEQERKAKRSKKSFRDFGPLCVRVLTVRAFLSFFLNSCFFLPFSRPPSQEQKSAFFSLFSLPSQKRNGVFVLLFSRLLFILFFFSSYSVCRLGESSRARKENKKNKKRESFWE